MWLNSLFLFLITLAIATVVGTRIRARFLMLLRNNHPELYHQLGNPPIWISTSLIRSIKTQNLIFSRTASLCAEVENARQQFRLMTVIITVVLLLESVLMLCMLHRAEIN
ncbi:hypothetical protein ACFL4L_03655 [bacterium]